MSFALMGLVWETPLEGTMKLVALALADCHNHKSGRCDPSVAYVAAKCGLSEKTVRRAISDLSAARAIEIIATPGAQHQYRFTLDKMSNTPLPECPDTPDRMTGGAGQIDRGTPPPHIVGKPGSNLEENLFTPSTSGSTPADPPQPPRLNGAEAIPLVGGVEWHCPPALLTELDRLYPAVDPVQTFREIRAWCITNPGKRKTTRGVERFVNRWFAQEQDRHGRT